MRPNVLLHQLLDRSLVLAPLHGPLSGPHPAIAKVGKNLLYDMYREPQVHTCMNATSFPLIGIPFSTFLFPNLDLTSPAYPVDDPFAVKMRTQDRKMRSKKKYAMQCNPHPEVLPPSPRCYLSLIKYPGYVEKSPRSSTRFCLLGRLYDQFRWLPSRTSRR